jgi:hypothetical protein
MDSEIKEALQKELSVSVDIAGKALGLGRNAAYGAIKSGAIPSIRFGRKIICPTAPLRKMLGVDEVA